MSRLLEIKKKLIEDVLENATDDQIDQLFEKCTEILVGKNFNHGTIVYPITYQPTNPITQLYDTPLYDLPEIVSPVYTDRIILGNITEKISS